MRILLVDVDSKIPNVALCKLSAYLKKKAEVHFMKLGFVGYPRGSRVKIVDASGYDKVYVSVVFQINKNKFKVIGCRNVVIGGTGSEDITRKLPKVVDRQLMDYSFYPENKVSYGYITRGCIRKCKFCVVPIVEGKIRLYDKLERIIKPEHEKVDFLDNNILSYEGHKAILEDLVNRKIRFRFSQGLDIRLVDDENACLLSRCNYWSEYTFAFDDVRHQGIIEKKLKIVKKRIPQKWRCRFYIYVDKRMSVEGVLYRIKWCRKHGCLPYVMRNENCWESKYSSFYKDLSAYCNSPPYFKHGTFEDFLTIRHKDKRRIQESVRTFREYSQK